MTRLHFIVVLTTLALTACRQQRPATVVPEAPRIESFIASSTTLAAPGQVTLSWSTLQATTVQVSTRDGALSVPEDRLIGTLDVEVQTSTIFVLTARGPGGVDTRALAVNVAGEPPALTLVALPPVVAGGETATLAWTAPGASSITLLGGSTPIDTGGQITSGSLVVRPDRDTVYTLSDGTRSTSTEVTVQVALLSAQVSPASAQVGDHVTVSWTSAGAERVIVSSPGRGQLAEFTDPSVVSFDDVVPSLPSDGVLTYEVTAIDGTQRMSRTATVFVGSQLHIVRFDAPEVAKAGAPYFVRWNTLAADRVQVLLEGQVLYESPTLSAAVQGVFVFLAPADDFQVTLVALRDRGERISRTEQVDSVGVPQSATLTATPASIASGDLVTLTFSAPEARRVRISDSAGQAVFSTRGQDAEAGSITITPGATTTYTISADNMLGDTPVTASTTVTVSGAAAAVRQVPATAITGQLVSLVPTVSGSLLYGFPHQTVLTSGTSNFVDISATGQRLLELGSDVATVTPQFSTRLWGELRQGPLTISRAGWMAWGAPLAVGTTEQSLPSTGVLSIPGIIAPYWDDLRLTAQSAVYVQVIGEAPEERLIVQWDKLQIGIDANSLVTFEVQVQQSGMVSFHYGTMIPNASPTFTVGLQDSTRQLGFDLFDTTPPPSNSSVYFFSPLTVPPVVRVFSGTSWGGFIKTGASTTVVSQRAVAVRVPGELTISELMFRPAPGVTAGQYVEAVNLTLTPYDLSGWVLRSNDGSSFTLPAGSTLPANGQLLLGASDDAAENDDAGVQVSWSGSGFSLGTDAGALVFGTTDAGVQFAYSGPADGGRGIATEVDPGLFVSIGNSTQTSTTCQATASFGAQTPSQLGTPGRNGGCGFAYQRQGVAPAFHDIASTGTPILVAAGPGVADQVFSVTLAAQPTDPAPRLFGVRAPTLTVSLNGWLSPRTITAAYGTNKNVPTIAEPIGTIAPFWDALRSLGTNSTIHWQKLEPGEDPRAPQRHWIIQWSHFCTVAVGNYFTDDITFQAKLFEEGSIEFHYAQMSSGTSTGYGDGASATIWVEDSTGRALVNSINTRVPRENTAIRFVAR